MIALSGNIQKSKESKEELSPAGDRKWETQNKKTGKGMRLVGGRQGKYGLSSDRK